VGMLGAGRERGVAGRLIEAGFEEAFIRTLKEETEALFSEGNFETSSSYCRIVNQKHYQRVVSLVDDAVTRGARLVWGGTTNPQSNFIAPVILSDVPADARVLEEEIFGPVIPVLSYQSLEEAIAFINSRPKPLALYVFTKSGRVSDEILRRTSAGGVCINDCGIHFLNHNLPFGGVNNSGIGKSHGYYGFLAFSNEKPVLRQKAGLTTVRPFYPPYSARTKRLLDWFLKLF